MIISPFTPLFFSPSTDKFGAKSKYVQLFARTDRIFVELILTAKEQEPIAVSYTHLTLPTNSLV